MCIEDIKTFKSVCNSSSTDVFLFSESLKLFCVFLGLMYVIETQKVMDLKINLMASYVIVPQTGFYNGTQNIILLDLGHLRVRDLDNFTFQEPSLCRAFA